MSSNCSQCKFKSFQNKIKNLNLNFAIFKEFLIITEFGKLGKLAYFAKFGSKIRQISLLCQFSLNFAKTQLQAEMKRQLYLLYLFIIAFIVLT